MIKYKSEVGQQSYDILIEELDKAEKEFRTECAKTISEDSGFMDRMMYIEAKSTYRLLKLTNILEAVARIDAEEKFNAARNVAVIRNIMDIPDK